MRYLQVRDAHSDSIISGSDPTEFSTSNPLRLFIIQAAIIIIVTRLLGWGLSKIRQPRVIAEVIGGILLGPTVMGRIPHFSQHIFPPTSLPYLNLVSTLGLVLFLFLVGLEVDLRVVKRCAKESTLISVAGMVLPFGLGAAVSVGIYNDLINKENVSLGHFILFTGVAMAITAFPVLARILTETKLLQTKVGVIVLAAGVGNDVVGWILLALTVALVNASSGLTALWVLMCTVGWALVLFFLIKPAFIWLARRSGSFNNGPNQLMMTLTLLLVLVSAWITDIIGVHPIFGSFLVGLMVPHEGGFAVAMTEKIEDLVSVIFLPIYFALSGLKTNLGSLDSGLVWGYTIAIIAIAFASKFAGCAGAARYCGFNLRESAAIGTLMSCKGLVELIVLNIGLSAGILDTRVFSMFVVMAVVSTVATTPLTLLAYPESVRTQLDPATHSHHGKTIDESHLGDEDDHSGFSAKRLLVVLDHFEHLPSLMTLVQLMQPTVQRNTSASTLPSSVRKRNGRGEKSEELSDSADSTKEAEDEAIYRGTPVLPSGAPFSCIAADQEQADISIDALRLIELTERTSAVMKVSESEDTMRADPIINVFRTFANLNGLPVHSSMAVVPQEEFALTVTNRCRAAGSNFILVPLTLNQSAPSEAQQQVASSSLSNPFESIFGRGTSDSNTKYSPQQTNFVRKVIQTAACDVGLLVDRAAPQAAVPHMNLNRTQTILLGFMGGPDDRVALQLVMRLCSSNHALSAVVIRFKRVAAEECGDVPLPSVPPTVHHELSLPHGTLRSINNADTMYPTVYNPQSSLEATLEDDLALNKLEEELATGKYGDRIKVKQVSTSGPLRALISAVETEQPTLVIVGRGRRQPTITHRDELRYLLHNGTSNGAKEAPTTPGPSKEKERALNSETCKVIGEPAMALSLANTTARTLTIAAGFNVSPRSQAA
ncbi:hypothetical protein IE53DRAFT_248687 [Violaceomyces palustris]|uniref:Uncharacterized protein n=1 Tax=Violaceomyces palustris TaxID=1673888 RepID=A0ACD0NNZ8_9BASI|nr:hypothetical protein IE53DRAFT_248687 [Violaceomyces palustris]